MHLKKLMCARCPTGQFWLSRFQNLCDNGAKTQPRQNTVHAPKMIAGLNIKQFSTYTNMLKLYFARLFHETYVIEDTNLSF